MRDSKLFDEAVEKFFGPLARKVALPLSKVRDGVYEIASQYFIMRIRLHTGHKRGLNVILRPATECYFDENKPGSQYGIGNFVLLAGEEWKKEPIKTDGDFFIQAQHFASASERFGLPYLLGEGKDFDAVKEMVRKKTELDMKIIKGYRFPKNVREEWI